MLRFIFSCIKLFKEIFPFIFYNPKSGSSAVSYTHLDVYKRQPETPRLLFKHSGIIELGLPTYLIIITGYDPERTRQVLGYYEPQKVFLVIQTGNQLNNNIKNTKELHLSLIHIFIRINIIHYLKIMLMNELLKMKFFELLSKTSQEVTNTEMQDAYGEFVKHIVAISNSEDYSYIFRMLNLTRIEIVPLKELYQCGQGEKCA